MKHNKPLSPRKCLANNAQYNWIKMALVYGDLVYYNRATRIGQIKFKDDRVTYYVLPNGDRLYGHASKVNGFRFDKIAAIPTVVGCDGRGRPMYEMQTGPVNAIYCFAKTGNWFTGAVDGFLPGGGGDDCFTSIPWVGDCIYYKIDPEQTFEQDAPRIVQTVAGFESETVMRANRAAIAAKYMADIEAANAAKREKVGAKQTAEAEAAAQRAKAEQLIPVVEALIESRNGRLAEINAQFDEISAKRKELKVLFSQLAEERKTHTAQIERYVPILNEYRAVLGENCREDPIKGKNVAKIAGGPIC